MGGTQGVRESWLKSLRLRESSRGMEIKEIPVDRVVFNPYQPRKRIGEEELRELSESIRDHGIIQPVIVRRLGKGYELVAGERRVRASKMAGLSIIPAVVRDLTDEEAALLALIENLQREDLNYFEEAEGYQRLIHEFRLTQEELARKVGKSQSAVANKLRLLKLSETVRRALLEKKVTERHARALLRLPSEEAQARVLAKIVEENLTVREMERLVTQELHNISREITGAGKQGRRVRVFKDLRIFLNAFRQAVSTLQKAGVKAEIREQDRGEFIEVYVRVSKVTAGPRATKH